jgi:hypothetical protein
VTIQIIQKAIALISFDLHRKITGPRVVSSIIGEKKSF